MIVRTRAARTSASMVLAGDVGGTKTLLALYRVGGGRLTPVRTRRYAARDYRTLESVCIDFVGRGPAVDAACFGVPGVVIKGTASASNLAWELSEASLRRALRGAQVRLLNDLAATARGVLHLRRSEVAALNRGRRDGSAGNIAIIAAGTGLGEAALVHDQDGYHAMPSEGGHASFAPQGAEQIELLQFLEREFRHVSWERVLSGPGLLNIYRFARARCGEAEPRWLTRALRSQDPAEVITDCAANRRDPACTHAVGMFCAMYGSEAANLALKVLALGGVYLCGGIAPKILEFLKRGEFMRAFADKGRLAPLLREIEVSVVLAADVVLRGAADCASAMVA